MDVSVPGKPREIHDHPAILLWRHINPVESPVVFIEQLFADLICEGNFFAWLDVQDGEPRSMIRLPPEEVVVIPDNARGRPNRIIAGYEWRRRLKVETYDASLVIHVRTRNPNPIYRGLGLLQRARDQIRFEHQLRSWKENQIKNGVPTSMVVSVKRMFANEQEWERFREETWERMRGIANAGKPMFIRAEDVDVKLIDRPDENEVAFINSLTYTRNELAMLFGVPPSRLSDYSNSFRANAAEQSRTYWQDTIMSWHRLFLDYLNSTFIPRWFPQEIGRDMLPRIAFAYDYSKVQALALTMREMATTNEILIRNAMRSPNEGAGSMGDPLHDDPKADDLYMNGRPLGEEQQEIGQPGSQPVDGEQRPDGATEPDMDENGEEDNRAAVSSGGPGLGSVTPRPVLRAVPGDIVDEDEEAKRLAAILDPLIKEMVKRAAAEEIEISGLLGSFDAKHPEVLEMVRRQRVLVSEAVTNTTAVEVRRALALAIESGYDPDKMRKAIRNTFRAARADWRLDRVARTESHQAHEGGGYQALRQNGVRRKEWVISSTGNVRNDERSNHEIMDGQVREIDEPFDDIVSGARLMFPGDIAGARTPADVINCNCLKIGNFSDLDDRSFHRSIDKSAAIRVKANTRRKFEGAFKTATRRFLKGMEERAIEELNEQIGEKPAASAASMGVAR
jgi:HK97 family phage portal protein